ncbi:MAG: ABC transporter permease [Gammaproteobacteria bacterium]|nr:ABC transporter permease [Gammaproteobacteria bacterium]MYG65628.1 ABC transporter permease [Gammaproteobacteria bacterium]
MRSARPASCAWPPCPPQLEWPRLKTVRAMAAGRRFRVDPSLVIVTVLLVAVLIAGFTLSERFGTLRNLMNVLEQAAALGFVSLGQSLVVLVGGIDLSVGAVVTASTVLMAAVVEMNPAWMVPMIPGVLAFGAFIGFINGFLVLRTGVHPLIVTLGTGSVLNGLVLLYTLQPTGGVPYWFEEFAYGRIGPVPVAGLVMLVCFGFVWFFLKYTAMGRSFYAVGGGEESARLSGIDSNRVILIAYTACGFFVALAGAYFVSRTGVGDPRVGEPFTLASITPVIVGGILLGGGKGNVLGALLGVFLISLINNLLNYMDVSTFIQWIVQGLIILVAVSVYVNRERKL